SIQRRRQMCSSCSPCHSSPFCFQAEDGIRGRNVTGVQTCALPISDSYSTGGDDFPEAIGRCDQMNHDALIIPLNDTEELVVASDNSGSIGKKPFDEISVPYDIVGYSVFRVAYMECAAAGGVPCSIIMHNFNGDDVWGSLINGIRRRFTELGIQELPITGSTESNFILKQSATSMTILGKRPRKEVDRRFNRHCHVAIIGKPLVGNEV